MRSGEKQEIGDSIFSIAGKNEDGITRAFGAILRKDKVLLKRLIHLARQKSGAAPIGSISQGLFEETEFWFERFHKRGRTDIEIKNVALHLIIECKIGRGRVGKKQASQYLRDLQKSDSRRKFFITMTELRNPEFPATFKKQYPGVYFSNITWDETLLLLKKREHRLRVDLASEYKTYLTRSRKMAMHDMDIWCVSITKPQEIDYFLNGRAHPSKKKLRLYRNNKQHTPVFIGRRVWDEKKGKAVVKELYPVLDISDRGSALAKKYGSPRLDDYLYWLGEPLPLKFAIVPRRGKFSQTSAMRLMFPDVKLLD